MSKFCIQKHFRLKPSYQHNLGLCITVQCVGRSNVRPDGTHDDRFAWCRKWRLQEHRALRMEIGPMQAKAHMVLRLWIYLFQWSTLQSHWMLTNLCSARDPSLESCMLVNIKPSPLFGVCYPFNSSSCFVFVLFSTLCRRETAKKPSFSTKSHALAVLCHCPYDLRLHVHQRKQRLFLLEFMHPLNCMHLPPRGWSNPTLCISKQRDL
jgi:hypothetical protein